MLDRDSKKSTAQRAADDHQGGIQNLNTHQLADQDSGGKVHCVVPVKLVLKQKTPNAIFPHRVKITPHSIIFLL